MAPEQLFRRSPAIQAQVLASGGIPPRGYAGRRLDRRDAWLPRSLLLEQMDHRLNIRKHLTGNLRLRCGKPGLDGFSV